MGKRLRSIRQAADAGDGDELAVLNLQIDASNSEAEPREIVEEIDAFQTPCSISGAMAGVSGGALGYAFGFGGRQLCSSLSIRG